MAKRITRLLEEQENQSKLLRTRNLAVEVERTQEDHTYLPIQESRVSTPDREEVLAFDLTKYHQRREFNMPRRDKNQNGKRNLVM
jgi:hypothetical protein